VQAIKLFHYVIDIKDEMKIRILPVPPKIPPNL